MSETTNTPESTTQERVPTAAEMEAYRKNMQAYYKEQMPLLKAQLEYERTIADIEEARVKAMTMVIRQAQLKAGPPREAAPAPSPENEERREPSSDAQPGVRKLKSTES